MTGRGRAFTLVEILLVVGIAGIILAAGLVPLMYTARLMADTRAAFTLENGERSAVSRMTMDARELISINESGVVKLLRGDQLDADRDYLALWTLTPSYSMAPVCAVVFGLPPKSVMGNEYEEGLYRWLLSDDKKPADVTPDDLTPERGRLILRGVKGIRFSALSGSEWVDTYAGGMPQALRVGLDYGDDKDERVYEVWLPKF
jgi:prepilin-type N-terminal cleavage/methylation domain-containing protein